MRILFIVKPTINWTLSFGALTMHPTFLAFSRDSEVAPTECERHVNCATPNAVHPKKCLFISKLHYILYRFNTQNENFLLLLRIRVYHGDNAFYSRICRENSTCL